MSSTTYALINPATEEVVTTVELLDADATDEAVARSKQAFASWRLVAPGDRSRLLRRFADAVDGDLERLARLEVTNAGHTIADARWEAGNARDVIAYYSAAPERMVGQQIPVPDGLDVTFHEPIGVVGSIVPWNFPMPIASWSLAPALAAGNTVVLKPAELTPLTALRLAELALEAGIPEHVFQVLPGAGAVVGQRLVDHPDVGKIAFTGSGVVGRRVMAGCAALVKPVTLELGGKSANVVFADADLEVAAASAPYAVFANAGQDCCARSRILVERSAYETFMARFEDAVKAVVVTDPADERAEMGPLISAAQRDRVASYLPADAPVAFRGSAPSGQGFWYPPTVVTPSSRNDRLLREEIFGPVVAVMPFEDEADAVRLANGTPFGLVAGVWTRDAKRSMRVARAMRCGQVFVNAYGAGGGIELPFGGVKKSGHGREKGFEGLYEFCATKTIVVSHG
jgi:acyl-CoA reductase-like NAD-dependent aldehyde dehydrogenase